MAGICFRRARLWKLQALVVAVIAAPLISGISPRWKGHRCWLATSCSHWNCDASVATFCKGHSWAARAERPLVVRYGSKTSYESSEYYTRRAREAGLPARSYYKLEEIDTRLQIINQGMRVLDLGCAPGSWTTYASCKVGPKGRVLGVDLRPVARDTQIRMGANTKTIVGDAFDEETYRGIPQLDVVISDMAPDTTQAYFQNAGLSASLVRLVISVAETKLKEGGSMIAKLFESPDRLSIMNDMKEKFEEARLIRPESTRRQSRELYVIGLGYKKVLHMEPPLRRTSPRIEQEHVSVRTSFDGW